MPGTEVVVIASSGKRAAGCGDSRDCFVTVFLAMTINRCHREEPPQRDVATPFGGDSRDCFVTAFLAMTEELSSRGAGKGDVAIPGIPGF